MFCIVYDVHEVFMINEKKKDQFKMIRPLLLPPPPNDIGLSRH